MTVTYTTYVYNNSDITYSAAETAASTTTLQGVDGHLMTIETEAENTQITEWLRYNSPGVTWVGISESADQSSWIYSTGPDAGSEIGFTAWASASGTTGPGLDHVTLHTDQASMDIEGFGAWYIYHNDATATFVTEYQGLAVFPGYVADSMTVGSDGSVTIVGNNNANTIIGTAIAEELVGLNGNDIINGFGGNDRLNGGSGADRLSGGDSNDVLDGGIGNDKLYGDGGKDTLVGGANNDLLFGGRGSDKMIGGLGSDKLTGGTGGDFFIYTNIAESAVGLTRDVINDFSLDDDFIDLSAIDADTTLSGNQSFTFISDASFSHTAGEVRFSGGILQGDVNGDGIVDFEIDVKNVTHLSLEDFVL